MLGSGWGMVAAWFQGGRFKNLSKGFWSQITGIFWGGLWKTSRGKIPALTSPRARRSDWGTWQRSGIRGQGAGPGIRVRGQGQGSGSEQRRCGAIHLRRRTAGGCCPHMSLKGLLDSQSHHDSMTPWLNHTTIERHPILVKPSRLPLSV